MKDAAEVIAVGAYVAAAVIGLWMILYARASRISMVGGVLVTMCSVMGIVTAGLPRVPIRYFAQALIHPLMMLSVLVFIFSWRDGITSGRFQKPASLRALFRAPVRNRG